MAKTVGTAFAAIIVAAIAAPAHAQTVHRDENILVAYFDDPATLSKTLIAGIRSDDDKGQGALVFSCDAEKRFMGALVLPQSEPEELGNTVRVAFEDGKERAFRGRAMAIPAQLQFGGGAVRGTYFITDPDNLRMARPANMRFINAVTSAKVTISIVNGDDAFSADFDATPHRAWIERVAEDCDRQIGQGID